MSDKVKNVKEKLDEAKKLVARLETRALQRTHQDISELVITDTKSRTDEKSGKDSGYKSVSQRANDQMETSVNQGDIDRENNCPKDQTSKQLAAHGPRAKQKDNEDLQDLKSLGKLLEDVTQIFDILGAEIEERQTPAKTTGWSWLSFSKAKTIQVLSRQLTQSINDFLGELQQRMKKIVEFKVIGDVSRLQQHEKFIVVCPFSTRLEPDIDFSLQGVDKSKILVAVVLHQVRPGKEPVMSTEKKICQQEKYSGISFIDIAFDMDQKIYSCEMNKKAETTFKAIVKTA